jgi:preprotein translocase subunit SecD
MRVELAGAVAFAGLGLVAGALLRPQPGDFRPDPAFEASGFTAPPSGPVGGADPTGGWNGGGWTGVGPVPDYVVGTDSRQPPPGYVPPTPAWEEPEPANPPQPADVAPSPSPAPAPAPTPGPVSPPAPPPSAGDDPSPSASESPKEGA